MQASKFVWISVTVMLWLAAVAAPIFALLALLAASEESAGEIQFSSPVLIVLLRSVGWSAAVVVVASIIAWWPGQALGRAMQRTQTILAAAYLVPICLPAYAVFYAWYQLWPADSGLYAWAARHDAVPLVREATLFIALTLWSWPIIAWCIAGAVAGSSQQLDDAVRLHAGSVWRRFPFRLREAGRGLALGMLFVFLLTMSNTTSFDLAGVFTWGNELRAVDAQGGSATQLVRAAAPGMLVTLAGAICLFVLINRLTATPPDVPAPVRRWTFATALTICALSIVPVLIVCGRVTGYWGQFLEFQGESVLQTLTIALVTATIAGLVMFGHALLWDAGPTAGRIAGLMTFGWLLVALLPATLIAVALEWLFNRPSVDFMYNSHALLVLGLLSRFSFIAALLGLWMIRSEPARLRDVRILNPSTGLVSFLRAHQPRAVAAGLATLGITLVFVLGEIPLTARIAPPATAQPLASVMLNDMHFQRPREALAGLSLIVMLAILVAIMVAVLANPLRLRGRRHGSAIAKIVLVLLMSTATLGLVGCDSQVAATTREATEPLNPMFTFGGVGLVRGKFDVPRCIAVDENNGFVYIIDKSARVQRFNLDGEAQVTWFMPAKETGKPTGLNIAPNGDVYVADTHYYRVIAYDRDGNELLRFGEYGTGPGQFIYPTDIEFGVDGRLYVSEYGGNDRISVFSPEGDFEFSFGSLGTGPGEYNRPQSLAFSRDQSELYIADACNHRIVVVDPQGEVLRILGEAGRDAGQLQYPYDVLVLEDGSLLVAEYGNNRVQHLAADDGRCLGLYGTPGIGPGQLKQPWGIDGTGERVFVLDTGNSRVQVIPAP